MYSPPPGAPSNTAVVIGYGASEVSNALAAAVTSGSGTTITLADDAKVTFTGVNSLNSTHVSGF